MGSNLKIVRIYTYVETYQNSNYVLIVKLVINLGLGIKVAFFNLIKDI